MIVIESKYDNLEEALSEVFSDRTKGGVRTRRLLIKGMATIYLSNQKRWCSARAYEVQKKLRQHVEWRKYAPRLNMGDHYYFIDYDTADLTHLYCDECATWIDFSREELPTTGRFKLVPRPVDH